jgi:CYTH domain-containing protein
VVPTSDHIWEIDFFSTSNISGYYLVMAEVELAESADKPDSIPDFISSKLLHTVVYDDPRFNNRSLARPKAVKELLTEIRNVAIQPTQNNTQ